MKDVSFILQKKLNGLFGPPNSCRAISKGTENAWRRDLDQGGFQQVASDFLTQGDRLAGYVRRSGKSQIFGPRDMKWARAAHSCPFLLFNPSCQQSVFDPICYCLLYSWTPQKICLHLLPLWRHCPLSLQPLPVGRVPTVKAIDDLHSAEFHGRSSHLTY